MTKGEATKRIHQLEAVLADLLAAATNMYLRHKKDMYSSDQASRSALLDVAQQILDEKS